MQTINDKAAEHPVDMAARLMGGRPAMAASLDVSVAAVGNWKVRGVPIEKCPRIERATGGAVTRKDLRPDDWQDLWPELAPALASTAHTATETIAPPVNPIQAAEPHSTEPLRIAVQRRQGSRYEKFLMVKGV